MRRVDRDLAAEGYAVLIPDLFARGSVRALCVAATMRTTVTGRGAAMDDLEAARRWLADRPEVDGTRLGAIGFCMGGSFALLLARTGLYKVSAPFYGRPPDLPRSCPVVAGFGGRDVGMRGAPEKLTPTSMRSTCRTTSRCTPTQATPSSRARRAGPRRATAADPRRVPRGQRARRAPQGRRVLRGAPRLLMSELASESSTQRPREALTEPGGGRSAELAQQAAAGRYSEGGR